MKDALSLEDNPLVDRAHRALRKRPNDSEPPCPLTVRLHYFQDVTTVLRKAAELKELTRARRSECSPTSLRRWQSAGQRLTEQEHKPGVRYGTLFPAKLRVTFNGTEKVFTDPREAEEFAELRFGTNRRDAEDVITA